MKKALISCFAIIAIAASCTKSEMNISEAKFKAPDVTASIESSSPFTRTSLSVDEEGVGTIYWKPADQINLFYGSTSVLYTSTNTEPANTVVFNTTATIGSKENESTDRWGLYPYNEQATYNGTFVNTTLPDIQYAVPNSFDDDLFIMLAHSENNDMEFLNVCGGIKFSLSRNDVKRIVFSNNQADDDIAGDIALNMVDGFPHIIDDGEEITTITILPKTGTTFAANTDYYIVMLPVTMSKGFTMTFETEDKIGVFHYTNSVQIKRSVFSKKSNIDTYANFSSKLTSLTAIDLGLSVNWGSCNLGASSPEEFGNYYAWGETSTKSTYSWNTYKWCEGTHSTLTKYVLNEKDGIVDNKRILDSDDDAVVANIGGKWRMPTNDECTELIAKSLRVDTRLCGVDGCLIFSKIDGYTDSWIFMPHAGGFTNKRYDSYGHYWSSQPDYYYNPAYRAYGYAITIDLIPSGSGLNTDDRCKGLPIRPVYTKN